MPLSCSCNDDYDYYANPDDDFTVAVSECKCRSCWCKIKPGQTVLRFECYRWADPESDDPEDIKAEEEGEDYVYLPDEYLCEICGEIALNLHAAGFCISISEHMPSLLKEYQEMTGFDPEKYKDKNNG